MSKALPLDQSLLIAAAPRFWKKVNKTAGDAGCWIYTACIARNGYGQFGLGKRVVKAHRVAWALTNDPVPHNRVLDHLCRNRACVNPAHLEVVTEQTNALRGQTLAAHHAAKTHCPQGHPYDFFNTRINSRGYRSCRICHQETSRRYRANKNVRRWGHD